MTFVTIDIKGECLNSARQRVANALEAILQKFVPFSVTPGVML